MISKICLKNWDIKKNLKVIFNKSIETLLFFVLKNKNKNKNAITKYSIGYNF